MLEFCSRISFDFLCLAALVHFHFVCPLSVAVHSIYVAL